MIRGIVIAISICLFSTPAFAGFGNAEEDYAKLALCVGYLSYVETLLEDQTLVDSTEEDIEVKELRTNVEIMKGAYMFAEGRILNNLTRIVTRRNKLSGGETSEGKVMFKLQEDWRDWVDEEKTRLIQSSEVDEGGQAAPIRKLELLSEQFSQLVCYKIYVDAVLSM